MQTLQNILKKDLDTLYYELYRPLHKKKNLKVFGSMKYELGEKY